MHHIITNRENNNVGLTCKVVCRKLIGNWAWHTDIAGLISRDWPWKGELDFSVVFGLSHCCVGLPLLTKAFSSSLSCASPSIRPFSLRSSVLSPHFLFSHFFLAFHFHFHCPLTHMLLAALNIAIRTNAAPTPALSLTCLTPSLFL